VKFLTLPIQSGGVIAVRQATPSKQNRKGFELRDPISRRNLRLSLLRPLN